MQNSCLGAFLCCWTLDRLSKRLRTLLAQTASRLTALAVTFVHYTGTPDATQKQSHNKKNFEALPYNMLPAPSGLATHTRLTAMWNVQLKILRISGLNSMFSSFFDWILSCGMFNFKFCAYKIQFQCLVVFFCWILICFFYFSTQCCTVISELSTFSACAQSIVTLLKHVHFFSVEHVHIEHCLYSHYLHAHVY